MGMRETPSGAPDTYGLPEYFISEIVTEIDGPNVRIICGVKRLGVIHWLYSSVMRADRLVVSSTQVKRAACEAFTVCELLGGGTQGGH